MPTIDLVRMHRSISAKPKTRSGVQNLREWLLDSIEMELDRRAASAAAAHRLPYPQTSHGAAGEGAT